MNEKKMRNRIQHGMLPGEGPICTKQSRVSKTVSATIVGLLIALTLIGVGLFGALLWCEADLMALPTLKLPQNWMPNYSPQSILAIGACMLSVGLGIYVIVAAIAGLIVLSSTVYAVTNLAVVRKSAFGMTRIELAKVERILTAADSKGNGDMTIHVKSGKSVVFRAVRDVKEFEKALLREINLMH